MKKFVLLLASLSFVSNVFAEKIVNNSEMNDMVVTYMFCEGTSSPESSDAICHPSQEIILKNAKTGKNYLDIAPPQASKPGNYVWLFVTKALAQSNGKTIAKNNFNTYQCGAYDAMILNDMHTPYVLCQGAQSE